MRSVMRWVVVVGLVLGAVGCAEDEGEVDTTVLASDFDQSCVLDEDCAVVFDGDVCGCTVCPTASVAERALGDFNAAKAAVDCGDPISCPAIACGETFLGTCEESVCGIRKAVYIRASDYDAGCTTNEDCVDIVEGEVCEPCGCPSAAVNRSALADISAKRDAVTCRNPDVLCEPCIESVPTCQSGVCTL